jgi:hypothetical protein
MLGYKKEFVRRQNALEGQVAELKKGLAAVTKEASENAEAHVKELKSEISNLKGTLKALDEGYRAQAEALGRISTAFSDTTTAQAIDVVAVVEGMADRIARLEEKYNAFTFSSPEGSAVVPEVITDAPAVNPAPSAPVKRGRGRPRKYRKDEFASTGHTPAEAHGVS